MPKVKPRFKDGPPRHFIREWRNFRGYTLDELGEKIGVTNGALSQLERGQVNYTQPMLEALAEALVCEPRDLVGRPPDAEWGVEQIMASATPDQRRQLREIAITIIGARTGTTG